MFSPDRPFTGFSVDDLDAAASFYESTIGLPVERVPAGLELIFATGMRHFVYPKENHEPATFTVLNFVVDDLAAAVDDLAAKGVDFHTYDDENTDARGIHAGGGYGPDIAWFKDPAGNVLSLIQS